MYRIRLRLLVMLICLCTGLAAAAAEAPGRTGPEDSAAPAAQSRTTQPVPVAADADTNTVSPPPQSGRPPGSLSRELNRSGGIIHPPPSGDRAVIAPPNQRTSRMPVIKPPGTPGGNPQLQPK